MINNRIMELRQAMMEKKVFAYIVPSEDFHQSEYVGDYFKSREFITGFSGSAGFALITQEKSYLWTDARYFIQAEIELKGSEVILQKMGKEGVPTLFEFLEKNLPESANIGFDGRTVSLSAGEKYYELASKKNGNVIYEYDLVGQIWKDRPSLSKKKTFFLDESYSGEGSKSKIQRIREKMKENNCNTHVIASLDDICWILNMRGDDIKFSPLVLSYLVITDTDVYLFMDESKIDEGVRSNLEGIDAIIKPYDEIYNFVKGFNKDTSILIDPRKTNYALYKNIPSESRIVEKSNPSILFKAMKNETELNNIRKSHLKDGIAWVKFMYWLKNNIKDLHINEVEASDKLESFRKQQDGYLWPSFAPISGYADNAAIVHYSASEDTAKYLEPKGLYLSDTGGNYYEGSTDITRTLALGEISDIEKEHFTLVLKSHINLALANFLKGTYGYTLDILARKPLWDHNLNYEHGTGHGVGYLLNVHEGPSGFHYLMNPSRGETRPLEVGMLITNEPGIYIKNSHGIRIENEMIVIESVKNEYGQFYQFEQCTFVPIDLDAIDVSLLSDSERKYLNNYHSMIFEKVSPFLTKEESKWLEVYTRPI